MKIVTNENGGIGFEFPTAEDNPGPFRWDKTTLFGGPILYTCKYYGVAVGGKAHAILKILSENPGKWLDKNQIKDKLFTPSQAWTVSGLSREGVKKLVSRKTYVAEAVRNLKFAGCARVNGNKRNYKALITGVGIQVLKTIEEKYGPTRG